MTNKTANYKTNIVISYGYNDDENKALQEKFPNNCEVFVTNCFTDVIAIPSIYQFINPKILSKDEINILLQYWIEVMDCENC